MLKAHGDIYLRSNAKRLLDEGRVTEQEITRMAKSIIRTGIAMGFYDRPVKDEFYLNKFQEHEDIALETARQSIVLLRNENNILPLDRAKIKNILLTGDYFDTILIGGGAARVEGYNHITLQDGLEFEFGEILNVKKSPSDEQIMSADAIIMTIGTEDSEGWDKSFSLPITVRQKILRTAEINPNVVVIVYSGGGIEMTDWNEKVAGLLYAWYPGQNGNRALVEIISGKICPSAKLPVSIEKKFEDSPGYPYLPDGDKLRNNWRDDKNMNQPVYDIHYNEGIFIGYRWYESRKIEPLYPFGFGLSYTSFEYGKADISTDKFSKGDSVTVKLQIRNTGQTAGHEVVQLYIQALESSVPRPVKELKGFAKVFLQPGELKTIEMIVSGKDLAFWDVIRHDWYIEPGDYKIFIGASSVDIRCEVKLRYE
jgi:beta-glucosidase